MAIKEFIIGPQNYFEQGYFDGDYTLPNVSKAFLECDVDQIKGGRVVTGLYYLDNYIDGTYYHDNSIRAELTVDFLVIQFATAGLGNYYNEGYFGSGYYEQRGSQFTLSAELTRIGENVFATGSCDSSTIFSCVAIKTVDIVQSLNAEFTQTAHGARERDIDLFAFSDAAIAIQVDVIRDNNISVSSVFNIATDGRRYRDAVSAEESLFTFGVINERNREFNIETQVAFSFSAIVLRNKFAEVTVENNISLSCIFSHIEGADLVAQNFASLTSTIEVTRDAVSSMSSSATLSASTGLIKQAASSVSSQFSVIASSRVLVRNVSYIQNSELQNGVNYSAVKIVNTNSKFGIGNLYVENPASSPENALPQYQVSNGSTTKLFSNTRTFSTTDGINYTSSANNIPNGHGNIIWDGSKYVTAQSPSTSGNVKVYTSTDGITWTLITTNLYSIPTFGYQPEIQFLSPYYYIACSTSTNNLSISRNTTLSGGTWVNRGTSNAGTNYNRGWVGSYNTGTEIGFFGRYDNAAYGTYGIRTLFVGNNDAVLTYDLTLYNQTDGYVSSGGVANGQIGIVTKFNDGTRNVYTKSGSTWSLVSSGGHDTIISTVNNRWFVESEGILSTGTSLSSLTAYGTYNNILGRIGYGGDGPTTISPVGYVGGVYTYSRDGNIYRSSNGTTWVSTSYLTGAYVIGSLTYIDPDNDMGNFATIDFWAKGAFNIGFYDTGYKTKEIYVTDRLILHIQTSYNNSLDLYREYTPGLWDGSVWNHVRLAINGSTASLYKNGVREVTTNSWLTDSFNAPLIIYNRFGEFYIDELLITDQLLTNPSVTSFTVPTKEYVNDSNTDLLLHFNNDLADDSRFNVIEQATLASTVTLSVSSSVAYNSYLATLPVIGSLSCLAVKNAEIVLSAFSNAALTANNDTIRYGQASLSSEFTETATGAKTLDNTITASSTFSQTVTQDRIRDNQITTNSIFSELTVGELSKDVTVSMTSQFAVTASINDRTRDPVLSLTATATLSATATSTLDSILLVMSAGTITTNAVKTAVIVKTLSTAFTMITDNAGSTIRVDAMVMSAGTMSVTAIKTTDGIQGLVSQFNLTADTSDSLNKRASADLNSEFTVSADNLRVRFGDITTNSIFSELAVVENITGNTISLTSTASMSIIVDKTVGISSALSSAVTHTTDGSRIRYGQATSNSQVDITIVGFTSKDVPVSFPMVTTLTAYGQLTKETLMLAFNNASLTVTVNRTRDTSSSMNATVGQTITFTRIRSAVIITNSVASGLIVVGITKGIISTLPIIASMTTVGVVLHTNENVYIIPFENRSYKITQETRTRKISQETREYKIRR